MNRGSKTFSKMVQGMLILVAILMFSTAGYLSYQYYAVPRCAACGMVITPEMREHFVISDTRGNRLYACCQACMLRLLDRTKGYDQVHIETFCDWYGPKYRIVIDAKEHGDDVVVTPETAQILLGGLVTGSCVNNRIAYNQTAVDMLLRDGYSQHTMSRQWYSMPEDTPIMSVSMAARILSTQIGIMYSPPKPWLIIGFAIFGTVVLCGSIVAHRSLMPKSLDKRRVEAS